MTTADFAAVVVAPGDTATTSLTVTNNSEIVEAYTFEVIGPCAPWATIEPERLRLYPGTSETVTVRLTPPRRPEVPAGDLPLAVRVLPTERPFLATVPETTVTVQPYGLLMAALAPRRRRAAWRAQFTVRLANRGNTPIDVGLDAVDPAEELRYTGIPSTTALPPGQDTEVRLKVRGSRPIWFGRPVTSSFQVIATPTNPQDPTKLDGELVQTALLPRWPLAALVLLLALAAGWFTLVRPAVTSTAVNSTDQPAADTPAATRTQNPAVCHTADLSAALGPKTEQNVDSQGQLGAAGTHYSVNLVWTNNSSHPCTMLGFPGVDIDGGTTKYSLPRTSDTPAIVTLAPGASANATIRYIDPTGTVPDSQPLWTPTNLDVTPPNETQHLTVPWTLNTAVYRSPEEGVAAASVAPVTAG